MKWTYILFCFFSLISCGSTSAISDKAGPETSLNGVFNVLYLNTKNVSSFITTLEFNHKAKQITGFSGCNRFSGSYTLNENSIKMSALATTRMLCQSESNTIEQVFLDGLTQVDSIDFQNNTLKMFSESKLIIEAKKQTNKNDLTFEYSTLSRGDRKKITINNESVLYAAKGKSEASTRPCQASEWHALIKTYNTINLDQISNLETPSKKFQFDGALLAKLKITSNGKLYETPPFDHGNPPEEIKVLVKEILSIGQIVE